jgi:hypothetical protein
MKESEVRYSFSRLTSFTTCKWAWQKTYLEGNRGFDSSFSQVGSLVHDVLEKYAKNALKLTELKNHYLDRFSDEVTIEFPNFRKDVDLKHLNINYYARFFANFEGYTGKVVSVERDFEYQLPNGSWFRGFIDLETETDEYYNIVDYKTGNKYTKKEMDVKKRQLLLYHKSIKTDKPIRLFFYFVKAEEPKPDGKKYRKPEIVEVKYTEQDLLDVADWAVEVIKEIESCKDFPYVTTGMNEKELKKQDFYCQYLCSHRFACRRPDKERIKPYGK